MITKRNLTSSLLHMCLGMTRLLPAVASSLLLFSFILPAQTTGGNSGAWSVRFTDNFIRLHPDTILYKEEAKSRKWNYEQGLILSAIHQLYKTTGDVKYFNYICQNLDYYVNEDGSIKTYEETEYNIDHISPGRMLLMLYRETKAEKYRLAAERLRNQLRNHPRTKSGGFWHKKIYPNQMWLDGLYMGQPFYAKYSQVMNDTAAFADIALQFRLMYENGIDTKTGLLYHAWDESREQKWADPESGTSPNFWGRSIGWYMMALVDALDYFPVNHPGRQALIIQLNALSRAVMNVRDTKTKVWYQLVAKPSLEGNYPEASATFMYIYALAKGVNKGYLPKSLLAFAKDSYTAALKEFVSTDADGIILLRNVCRVAGLGGKPYRDGSDAYYLGEPRRVNDFKGYGPLILAAVEIEKGERFADETVVGLDRFHNNEYKDGKRYHYIWEDTAFSGFSDWGKLFSGSGAKLKSIDKEISSTNLQGVDIFIIVDPDTPAETTAPNYISETEISEIAQWVNNGGVLVLMANDSANCEFTQLNRLSEKFGIHFNGDSENRVTGKNFEMGKIDSLPSHPIFAGVRKLYMKEISTIKFFDYAEPILRRGNKGLMVNTRYGEGFVFAVGDPWLYNEYIDNRKLPAGFDNLQAAKNLTTWLITKTKGAQ